MFAPSSAGNSSDDWSLGSGGSGGRSHRRSANTTPKNSVRGGSRDGGRSIVTASGVSRSAILPSAQVNLSSLRRPTTGLARVENLASSSSSTTSKSNMPIVESVGYYQAMIQAKIDETSKEMKRLRSETEMADVHSEPRMALESRHDALLNTVRGLEGDLADYNLAREYVRSGSSPGDVKKFTLAIISTNKKMEKDIDAVFFKRKKVEDELSSVEAEVARLNAVLESKILDGDDEKMDDYRSSLEQVKATITEMEQQEDDIVLIRHKLRTMELNDQGLGSQCLKKKKHVGNMKKLLEQVGEDIKLAQMADDEARECLLGKIVGLQLSTKELEEELSMLENELKTLHEIQKKNRIEKLMGGAAMACDRLFKKENSFKQYLERLPKMQTQLEEERGRLLSTIETLRCDISRTAKWMSDMDLPSKEEMELMRNDVAFARKHLDANQETMSILRQQKKKLMDEVCAMCSLTSLLIAIFTQVNTTSQSSSLIIHSVGTCDITRRTNHVRN
jgi:hypothetical protein